MIKQTIEGFILKALEIHSDKYDYSLVEYINSSTKVKIICKKHGIFEQRPNGHISQKQGCPKCDGKNKTTEEYVDECKILHNNKYDYSLVNYVNNKTKVKIICYEHGQFEQEANSHLMGRGCPKCINNYKTTEEYVNECKILHKNKYDYSLVKYINNKTKIKIICPIHGQFEQRPNSHSMGNGCPKCVGKNKTTEEYIDKCKKKHGDKYDYSLVNYLGVFKKVKIICPFHGEFEQMSDTHLKGHGCPVCRESNGEKNVREYLVENKIKFIPQHKFPECKDIKLLPFDFYLPDYNICIEYDGRQHFEVIDRWGGVEGLKNQKKKDKIKNDFCEVNKIKLIRISYKETIYNKLIEIK